MTYRDSAPGARSRSLPAQWARFSCNFAAATHSDCSTRTTSTVKSILADVNIWLATLVAAHPHHGAAARWWRAEVVPAGSQVAFCRLTQLGLLRLLSNERVMGPSRMDHARAWTVVRDVAAQTHVEFLTEPAGIDRRLADLSLRRGSSPSFWSDAYLAAFALAGRHRLATFDLGFRRFDGLDLLLLNDSGDVGPIESEQG